MKKALVRNNIVENIIVADNSFLLEGYVIVSVEDKPCHIGDKYEDGVFIHTPSEIDTLSETEMLKAQLKASNDRQEFLEELIAEMAMIVYA